MTDPTKLAAWNQWPLTERLVQLAAYHCDVLRAQEEPPGSNRGPLVDRYLRSAGLDPGYPWCAAFVAYLVEQCGSRKRPSRPAAVIEWARWAEATHRIVIDPDRGDLFFTLNADGTGHIGIVLENRNGILRTIEGNSNLGGSREGHAVVRRRRGMRGLRFIRL